jgi:hypothetical protein
MSGAIFVASKRLRSGESLQILEQWNEPFGYDPNMPGAVIGATSIHKTSSVPVSLNIEKGHD